MLFVSVFKFSNSFFLVEIVFFESFSSVTCLFNSLISFVSFFIISLHAVTLSIKSDKLDDSKRKEI